MPINHSILALIFPEFEALDFFGPLGSIIPSPNDYYTLKTVNVTNSPSAETSMKNGLTVSSTLSLADALSENEHFDTLFIPGGYGMIPILSDAGLMQQIGELADKASTVFTVCTGSIVLAATGMLDGRGATTNKIVFDEMTPSYPNIKWQKQARWVWDGKFLTSSGVTAGIDAGLDFIANTYVAPEERSADTQEARGNGDAAVIPGFEKEKALKFARFVAFRAEYRWHEDSGDDPFV
ncbi:hypothetical protein ASPWEDRAFT_186212 [Aspergillus wentii DTO 134E9]|uniref:DJ-1/PfpI domain-containing protein n=1 Tax=Aspergillus wentii DTO 134E9 TaxID=1073089 RepID=A0A1L9RAQ9_ASPWE|nr:uncharacterized protein ASPWEDRAFT_186212 [Aspergillus wentii DTO 134E9]KAI9934563.1 hypothetical protein MW887_000178 [Aspergillus wentii]OJJ31978.1 hypothetical protein ASPWEDRAFT_186212 [Aspergillus wentii DTO 134E9]